MLVNGSRGLGAVMPWFLTTKSTDCDAKKGWWTLGQRSVASLASKGRGKVATSLNKKRQSGRWGVVPASEQQEILVALASLIRAQRYDMALTILDNELSGGY